LSKDEDAGREEDATEPKGSIQSDVIVEKEVNKDEISNQNHWTESPPSEKGLKALTSETVAIVNVQGTSKHVAALVLNTAELVGAY
jgi:hypothetical protein